MKNNSFLGSFLFLQERQHEKLQESQKCELFIFACSCDDLSWGWSITFFRGVSWTIKNCNLKANIWAKIINFSSQPH